MSQEETEKPIVFAACRRGKDAATEGQSCSSKRAYNTTRPGGHASSFRCVVCGFSWTVPTGGNFNF